MHFVVMEGLRPPTTELRSDMPTTDGKKLILVADDRPSSRELLRTILERAGYAVVEAEDGEEAVARTREMQPDLILLDLQMPRLDGYGVLAQLRSDARFRSLPVVALTASAMRGDREKILEAGFTEYLSKPAGPDLVRETLTRLLASE